MIRSTILAVLAVVLAAGMLAPVAANAEQHTVGRAPAVAQVRFQLHVTGTPAKGATFWVAYGPLGGKFGVLRLSRQAAGTYVAVHAFPAGARGDFVYLAAIGQVRTPAGPAPGNHIVTIRHTVLTSIRTGLVSTVTWSAPVG